jgi:hypothetical protein
MNRYGENYFDGPMWNWFGLTYSSYLVLPRTLLCGMPVEWQQRMSNLLDEMKEVYDSQQINDNYTVILRVNGKFIKDPLAPYRHPNGLPFRSLMENERT